jgi:phenylalanyl-tRNA synthetase beta chain
MNNGVTPVNDVLDKIAYITLLTNTPMAVYDANKITNNFFIGTNNIKHNVLCFDNKERITGVDDILIKDDDNVISIAGCIGTKSFGINDQTSSIVIEICNFNYVNIRNTAQRLCIDTDAAKRFSKPLSNYFPMLTAKLVVESFSDIKYLKIFNKHIESNYFKID